MTQNLFYFFPKAEYFFTNNLVMAGEVDCERSRIADRIKAIAFREANIAGASSINREWVAIKL